MMATERQLRRRRKRHLPHRPSTSELPFNCEADSKPITATHWCSERRRRLRRVCGHRGKVGKGNFTVSAWARSTFDSRRVPPDAMGQKRPASDQVGASVSRLRAEAGGKKRRQRAALSASWPERNLSRSSRPRPPGGRALPPPRLRLPCSARASRSTRSPASTSIRRRGGRRCRAPHPATVGLR